MPKVTIGLVCEGATDYVIFERLFGSVAVDIGIDVEFRRLQPAFDASSRRTDSGGWLQVFQWCVRNSPIRRRPLFEGGSLFAGGEATACDYLIVHLDGDICEHIGSAGNAVHRGIDVSQFNLQIGSERARFLREVMGAWLDLSSAGEIYPTRHVRTPAIDCSETWIIAAHSGRADLEEDRNVMSTFIDLTCSLFGQTAPTKRSNFKKSEQRYRRIIDRLHLDIGALRANCRQFDVTCRALNM